MPITIAWRASILVAFSALETVSKELAASISLNPLDWEGHKGDSRR
jgi:hypothetical protein